MFKFDRKEEKLNGRRIKRNNGGGKTRFSVDKDAATLGDYDPDEKWKSQEEIIQNHRYQKKAKTRQYKQCRESGEDKEQIIHLI